MKFHMYQPKPTLTRLKSPQSYVINAPMARSTKGMLPRTIFLEPRTILGYPVFISYQ